MDRLGLMEPSQTLLIVRAVYANVLLYVLAEFLADLVESGLVAASPQSGI